MCSLPITATGRPEFRCLSDLRFPPLSRATVGTRTPNTCDRRQSRLFARIAPAPAETNRSPEVFALFTQDHRLQRITAGGDNNPGSSVRRVREGGVLSFIVGFTSTEGDLMRSPRVRKTAARFLICALAIALA